MNCTYLHHIADDYHLLLLNDILRNNKYIIISKKTFKYKYDLSVRIIFINPNKHDGHKLKIKTDIIGRRIYTYNEKHLKLSNNNYVIELDINGFIK